MSPSMFSSYQGMGPCRLFWCTGHFVFNDVFFECCFVRRIKCIIFVPFLVDANGQERETREHSGMHVTRRPCDKTNHACVLHKEDDKLTKYRLASSGTNPGPWTSVSVLGQWIVDDWLMMDIAEARRHPLLTWTPHTEIS